VTVTGTVGAGYVTVYPCGTAVPLTSTVNYTFGNDTVANSTIVQLNDLGRVCVTAAGTATHVIVDVVGYAPAASRFVPVLPARVLDSRVDGVTVDGVSQGGGLVSAESVVEIPVAGRAGVSGGAEAVVLNVTAAEPSGWGHVVAFVCGTTPPATSNVNFGVLPAVANMVVAPVSESGHACLLVRGSGTHLVADVTGYFAAGSSLVLPQPVRLVDTRNSQIVAPGTDVEISVVNVPGVGPGAETALLNVTTLEAAGNGFVSVHPCDEPVPHSSSINFGRDVYVRSNLVVTKLDAAGRACLAVEGAAVQLVVDLVGVVERIPA
jgi:hypothetical protein